MTRRSLWLVPMLGLLAGAAAVAAGAAAPAAAPAAAVAAAVATQSGSGFAATIARLSEDGGFFDTDNLISNERSYLDVMPALEAAGLSGGAYVGVGPDQNFSYIAQLRPTVAYLVDVRRDNLLLHLLFKALFSLAPGRVEYLSLLSGVEPPAEAGPWREVDVLRLVEGVEAARATRRMDPAVLAARVDTALTGFGVPLSQGDRATIRRFHRAFIDRGLDLRFETLGRAPQRYYPTYRDLLVQTEPGGRRLSFMASEERYGVVRALQALDRVIPVVGDLAGDSALAAIARSMTDRGETLSAVYVSNVEFYLDGGRFGRWVDNLARLPHNGRSVVIRSVFGGYAQPTRPGYGSSSHLQAVDDLVTAFAAGRIGSYGALVSP